MSVFFFKVWSGLAVIEREIGTFGVTLGVVWSEYYVDKWGKWGVGEKNK